MGLLLAGCSAESAAPPKRPPPLTPAILAQHCREAVGEPRVVALSPRLFVAIGYDLANTIVIKTDSGRIVVDAMMSPERAREAKAAIDERGDLLALPDFLGHFDPKV